MWRLSPRCKLAERFCGAGEVSPLRASELGKQSVQAFVIIPEKVTDRIFVPTHSVHGGSPKPGRTEDSMGRQGYPPEFRRRVLDLVAAGRRVSEVSSDRASASAIATRTVAGGPVAERHELGPKRFRRVPHHPGGALGSCPLTAAPSDRGAKLQDHTRRGLTKPTLGSVDVCALRGADRSLGKRQAPTLLRLRLPSQPGFDRLRE